MRYVDIMTKLCINTEKGELVINPLEILFLLAGRMYTTFVLECGTKHTVSGSMKSYLERLKETGLFVRIHRSHAVNKRAIIWFANDRTHLKMKDGTRLPIARRCIDRITDLFRRI